MWDTKNNLNQYLRKNKPRHSLCFRLLNKIMVSFHYYFNILNYFTK